MNRAGLMVYAVPTGAVAFKKRTRSAHVSPTAQREVGTLWGLAPFALFPVFHRSLALIASLFQQQQLEC